ncbi:MAG: hypothetical protein RIS64_2075 [Bacteroidota bacterium]|jgi:hypothetical protein
MFFLFFSTPFFPFMDDLRSKARRFKCFFNKYRLNKDEFLKSKIMVVKMGKKRNNGCYNFFKMKYLNEDRLLFLIIAYYFKMIFQKYMQ